MAGWTLFLLYMVISAQEVTSAVDLGPSFSCEGRISATERVICSDEELSAYDRAMAWAYAHKWDRMFGERRKQQQWLARRDSCSDRRDCVMDAYREWIEELNPVQSPGPTLERRGRANNQGADLLLGSMQSPAGFVSKLKDSGSLSVYPLRGAWYLFRVNATHTYDPHDGRGPNLSTGEAVGVVRLANGTGVWAADPMIANSCSARLTRMSATKWLIEEGGGICSGIGATLTGIYGRK